MRVSYNADNKRETRALLWMRAALSPDIRPLSHPHTHVHRERRPEDRFTSRAGRQLNRYTDDQEIQQAVSRLILSSEVAGLHHLHNPGSALPLAAGLSVNTPVLARIENDLGAHMRAWRGRIVLYKTAIQT